MMTKRKVIIEGFRLKLYRRRTYFGIYPVLVTCIFFSLNMYKKKTIKRAKVVDSFDKLQGKSEA